VSVWTQDRLEAIPFLAVDTLGRRQPDRAGDVFSETRDHAPGHIRLGSELAELILFVNDRVLPRGDPNPIAGILEQSVDVGIRGRLERNTLEAILARAQPAGILVTIPEPAGSKGCPGLGRSTEAGHRRG
jgi:hypothetical protein